MAALFTKHHLEALSDMLEKTAAQSAHLSQIALVQGVRFYRTAQAEIATLDQQFEISDKLTSFRRRVEKNVSDYLHAKVVYKSGKSAWVWSSYRAQLPQTEAEAEALKQPPAPMAWVWSHYRAAFPAHDLHERTFSVDKKLSKTIKSSPTTEKKSKALTKKKEKKSKAKKLRGPLATVATGVMVMLLVI